MAEMCMLLFRSFIEMLLGWVDTGMALRLAAGGASSNSTYFSDHSWISTIVDLKLDIIPVHIVNTTRSEFVGELTKLKTIYTHR